MSNKVGKKTYTAAERRAFNMGLGAGITDGNIFNFAFKSRPENESMINGFIKGQNKLKQKKFSKMDKVKYYSKRVNDMSLDQRQRSYAKKWLARNSK